jgi:prepilin-type N-terminal cleavage/methylation domain-containing protein
MTRHRPDPDTERGLSLVEVVVSMVLLALVAMAFLPLAAKAAQAAAAGSTLATATRLVSKQMEVVRAGAATTCPVDADNAPLGAPVTDPRGVVLETRTDVVGTCPGVVRYVVTVTRTTPPTGTVATATTLVSVSAP